MDEALPFERADPDPGGMGTYEMLSRFAAPFSLVNMARGMLDSWNAFERALKGGEPLSPIESLGVAGMPMAMSSFMSAPAGSFAAGALRRHPVQQRALQLTDDVLAFEKSLEGRPPAEVAAAIEQRYGFPVSPDDVANKQAWWHLVGSDREARLPTTPDAPETPIRPPRTGSSRPAGFRWDEEARALLGTDKSARELAEMIRQQYGAEVSPNAVRLQRSRSAEGERPPWLRPAYGGRAGRGPAPPRLMLRRGRWVIYDNNREIALRLPESERALAEQRLADYVASKGGDDIISVESTYDPFGGASGAGAEAGGLPGRGDLSGSASPFQASGGAPRQGIPSSVNIPGRGRVPVGPIPWAEEAARRYMSQAGVEGELPSSFPPFDPERAARIAQAYDEMAHDPTNPLVRESYDAMIDETIAQWKALKDSGLEVEFLKPGMDDPYAASPALGYLDMLENRHLWVFPTDQGFGTINQTFEHPLLTPTGITIDGREMLANDLFRIVHDVYGHNAPGNPFFRAPGEERAWRLHSAMYSPTARNAMTGETRGQNSWVNYGPYGEQNRTASAADTVYADQKAGRMPDWTLYSQGLPFVPVPEEELQ